MSLNRVSYKNTPLDACQGCYEVALPLALLRSCTADHDDTNLDGLRKQCFRSLGDPHAAPAARTLALLDAQRATHQAQHDEDPHDDAKVAVGRSNARRLQQLVEPLSDRELEVLRLLAAGYSNRGIAAALVIAVGTVKRHVSNIAGKLGAESRLAAVARARELCPETRKLAPFRLLW